MPPSKEHDPDRATAAFPTVTFRANQVPENVSHCPTFTVTPTLTGALVVRIDPFPTTAPSSLATPPICKTELVTTMLPRLDRLSVLRMFSAVEPVLFNSS